VNLLRILDVFAPVLMMFAKFFLVLTRRLHTNHMADVPVVVVRLSLLILLVGCGSTAHLTPEALRNAPYKIPGVGTIRFDAGSYDLAAPGAASGTPLHIGQIDLFAYGDLDGDGTEDAVTFLSRSDGGPQIYISMEAFLNRGGAAVHAGGTRLGDRIAIDSLSIEARTVTLSLITAGPGDSLCCPTLHVRREYAFENGSFIELTVRENK